MQQYGELASMGTNSETGRQRPYAASEPHCGVCDHLYFDADWERTPRCTVWGQATTIRVGDICEKFTLRTDLAIEPIDGAEDVEVDWSEQVPGRKRPFYATRRDGEKDQWLCANCRTLDVAVGPMGGFECNECGNRHNPREWDAAYL